MSSKPLRVKQELLPTIVLYRRLLRIHNKVLPIQMKLMGDEYLKVPPLPSHNQRSPISYSLPRLVQAEWRRTRTTTNPLHLVGFLTEWQKYLDFHEAQLILLNHQQSIDSLQSVQDHQSSEQKQQGATEEVVEAAKERVREGQKLSEEIFEKVSSSLPPSSYRRTFFSSSSFVVPSSLGIPASPSQNSKRN